MIPEYFKTHKSYNSDRGIPKARLPQNNLANAVDDLPAEYEAQALPFAGHERSLQLFKRQESNSKSPEAHKSNSKVIRSPVLRGTSVSDREDPTFWPAGVSPPKGPRSVQTAAGRPSPKNGRRSSDVRERAGNQKAPKPPRENGNHPYRYSAQYSAASRKPLFAKIGRSDVDPLGLTFKGRHDVLRHGRSSSFSLNDGIVGPEIQAKHPVTFTSVLAEAFAIDGSREESVTHHSVVKPDWEQSQETPSADIDVLKSRPYISPLAKSKTNAVSVNGSLHPSDESKPLDLAINCPDPSNSDLDDLALALELETELRVENYNGIPILLGPAKLPPRPAVREPGASIEDIDSLQQRSVDAAPPPTFLQTSPASHLRDDVSSEVSGSSCRTPSETSSTPSNMKIRKCHICDKPQIPEFNPLVKCCTCRRQYHPSCHKPPIAQAGDVNAHNISFWKCSRCVKKRMVIPSEATVKRTGSKLKLTHDVGHSPYSNVTNPTDEEERPSKRQKTDHWIFGDVTSAPRTVNEAPHHIDDPTVGNPDPYHVTSRLGGNGTADDTMSNSWIADVQRRQGTLELSVLSPPRDYLLHSPDNSTGLLIRDTTISESSTRDRNVPFLTGQDPLLNEQTILAASHEAGELSDESMSIDSRFSDKEGRQVTANAKGLARVVERNPIPCLEHSIQSSIPALNASETMHDERNSVSSHVWNDHISAIHAMNNGKSTIDHEARGSIQEDSEVDGNKLPEVCTTTPSMLASPAVLEATKTRILPSSVSATLHDPKNLAGRGDDVNDIQVVPIQTTRVIGGELAVDEFPILESNVEAMLQPKTPEPQINLSTIYTPTQLSASVAIAVSASSAPQVSENFQPSNSDISPMRPLSNAKSGAVVEDLELASPKSKKYSKCSKCGKTMLGNFLQCNGCKTAVGSLQTLPQSMHGLINSKPSTMPSNGNISAPSSITNGISGRTSGSPTNSVLDRSGRPDPSSSSLSKASSEAMSPMRPTEATKGDDYARKQGTKPWRSPHRRIAPSNHSKPTAAQHLDLDVSLEKYASGAERYLGTAKELVDQRTIISSLRRALHNYAKEGNKHRKEMQEQKAITKRLEDTLQEAQAKLVKLETDYAEALSSRRHQTPKVLDIETGVAKRYQTIDHAVQTENLAFPRFPSEFPILKESDSTLGSIESKEPDTDTLVLHEELQKLKDQLATSHTEHGISSTNASLSKELSLFKEKDVFKAWPDYRPENVWFDSYAKIAEIKARASRKATFGQKLSLARRKQTHVHRELERPLPIPHRAYGQSLIVKAADIDEQETELEGEHGTRKEVPDSQSNASIKEEHGRSLEPSFEDVLAVPPDAVPVLKDNCLAYRNGTVGSKEKSHRRSVYRVGRNVAGQLK
ncbi:MAG: hypothetical protein M1827_005376 [Pycnora praestabilis]|nr:MAG: hypothetical protein M1827_005376 [Pycnora praestabilis]